jgi:hypothetical protein
MALETATFWLNVITAIVLAAWFAGVWFVRRTAAVVAEPLRGEARVAVAPAHVVQHVTGRIAHADVASAFHRATVDAATGTEVRWHANGPRGHRGSLRAAADGSGSRVAWEIVTSSSLLRGARIVTWCGALAILALHWVMHEYVLPNEHPAVRGQVFQMVQAVHLLWPPFLLAGLVRKLRRTTAEDVERTVHNAAFVAATPAAVPLGPTPRS